MAKKNTETEIQFLPLNEVKPYEDTPFKVRIDDSVHKLVESIKENGMLVPVIARPQSNGTAMKYYPGIVGIKPVSLQGLNTSP